MSRMHQGLAVCLLLAIGHLAACAVKPIPLADIQPKRLESVWNLFQETYASSCSARDFSARGSVSYTSGERSSRVLFYFWGRTQFPVRMDLQAGVGTMLAHWREDEQGWIGYHPSTSEAFIASDSRLGAATLGLTMPLRLDALAQILIGCWGRVIPQDYVAASFTGRHFDYSLEGEPLGGVAREIVLSLSADGRPKVLRREGPGGWEVVIEEWFDERLPLSPRKLRLTQGENVALVRLQRLDFTSVSWQESDLFLDLPPGTLLREVEARQ